MNTTSVIVVPRILGLLDSVDVDAWLSKKFGIDVPTASRSALCRFGCRQAVSESGLCFFCPRYFRPILGSTGMDVYRMGFDKNRDGIQPEVQRRGI